MARPPRITPAEADLAYAAAQRVVDVHRHLSKFVRIGMTLAQVDAECGRVLKELDCRSCFIGYRQGSLPPFPNHACLSLNDCVVHGTSAYHTAPLVQGDLLKIDIGVIYRGWIGDAAWTYSLGEPSAQVKKLMTCGKESLKRGIPTLKPGNLYMAWARAVQQYVERECGFHLVRGLGGHGYGRSLHAEPYVSNVVPMYDAEWPDGIRPCTPGTLVAVEPMIAIGTGETIAGDEVPGRKNAARVGRMKSVDAWPIISADRSMSVHYEADVLITENGPRDLTEGMSELPDIVG